MQVSPGIPLTRGGQLEARRSHGARSASKFPFFHVVFLDLITCLLCDNCCEVSALLFSVPNGDMCAGIGTSWEGKVP